MKQLLARLFFILFPAVTLGFLWGYIVGSFAGFVVFAFVCVVGIHATKPDLENWEYK